MILDLNQVHDVQVALRGIDFLDFAGFLTRFKDKLPLCFTNLLDLDVERARNSSAICSRRLVKAVAAEM